MIVDNEVVFNASNKRYYLTEDYVYNKLGTDISLHAIDDTDTNLSTLGKRIIEEACDELYEYIEENSVDRLSTLYDFTVREEAHNAIKKALGLQLLYFIQVGDTSHSVEDGNKYVVNTRALRVLNGANCFHIRYTNIPKEW